MSSTDRRYIWNAALAEWDASVPRFNMRRERFAAWNVMSAMKAERRRS